MMTSQRATSVVSVKQRFNLVWPPLICKHMLNSFYFQVYVGGELVGGCDIMMQLHQNGELIEELSKVGIRSALLDKDKDK